MAMHQLKDMNSTADFVVMVQCKQGLTGDDGPEDGCLSPTELGVLSPAHRILYMPPLPKHHTTFYTIQYYKFWVLQLAEYRKVLYMDADILPICHTLDDLIQSEDADPSTGLPDWTIFAWKQEPATGGLFVASPQQDQSSTKPLFQKVVEDRVAEMEIHVAETGDWDESQGWGHELASEQHAWKSISHWPGDSDYEPITHGIRWSWPAAYADQGLLYYMAKYESRLTWIVNLFETEVWTHGQFKRSQDTQTLWKADGQYHCVDSSPMFSWKHPFETFPYSGFVHYTSDTKPWLRDIPNAFRDSIPTEEIVLTANDYWWYLLYRHFPEKAAAWTLVERNGALAGYPKLTDMIRSGQRRENYHGSRRVVKAPSPIKLEPK